MKWPTTSGSCCKSSTRSRCSTPPLPPLIETSTTLRRTTTVRCGWPSARLSSPRSSRVRATSTTDSLPCSTTSSTGSHSWLLIHPWTLHIWRHPISLFLCSSKTMTRASWHWSGCVMYTDYNTIPRPLKGRALLRLPKPMNTRNSKLLTLTLTQIINLRRP